MKNPSSRIRGTTPTIETAAKNLRKSMTPAEQKLWQALRKNQLDGLKFRRQHPIGNFIVDFFCSKYKFVIELDGEIHNQQTDYDAARTEELNRFGYCIIRFRNEEVLTNLKSVLTHILKVAFANQDTTF